MREDAVLYASLYIDEDVTAQLAVLVRQRGFQAASALEVGLAGQSDDEQLAYAAAHGMVLLTFNQHDFILVAKRWSAEGRQHAGILLSDQFTRQQFGELLRHVLSFLNTVSAEEMLKTVRYLSDFR